MARGLHFIAVRVTAAASLFPVATIALEVLVVIGFGLVRGVVIEISV